MSHLVQNRMVHALFHHYRDAARAYRWLQQHGHSKNDISLLMTDEIAPRFHAIVNDDKVEDKVVTPPGSYTSSVVGASVGAGLMATVGAGLGFLAGGPLGAALAATIPGAMVGGLVGGLVGYGFPEDTAREYDDAIHDGGVVIGVTLENPAELEELELQLTRMGGTEVSTSE